MNQRNKAIISLITKHELPDRLKKTTW